MKTKITLVANENSLSISEVLKSAPRYLSMRYNSLNFYVWETLFPEDYRKKVLLKLNTSSERKEEYAKMKSISDEATLLVFIFVVKNFFSEGSRMAKATVDTLKEFDVPGFNLGKSFFSERNENVVLGDKLAEKLIFLLEDSDAAALIKNSKHIYEILDKYTALKK
jgi:hypothetical protein